MDQWEAILNGFVVATQPINLLFVFLGALMGTFIGMLPGIGPAAGIALLLPVTFGLDPISALIMLAGIYYGAMYGNTSSAILINTPGTASAAMTTLDGHPMARAGRGGAALAIAAVSSFVAGTIGVMLLSFFSVPLTAFALRFGPPEYFSLMVFALMAVGVLTGKSLIKGVGAALIGLAIATIGADLQTGQLRFTFNLYSLQGGMPFLVVIVGMFAVAEVFISIERWIEGRLQPIRIQGRLWATMDEWHRTKLPILRGTFIGFLVGMLPGAGGTIATVLSYSTEKRLSKTPERFGKGAPEGVAAPEAANNATTCGAFVPLLSLGVPGSGTTAVLLAAFILYGIQPGPLLFQHRPDLVWGLINSMYIGNLMLLVLNLPLIVLLARILYAPPGIIMSLILSIATIGIYSLNHSVVELYMLLIFGLLGYLFRKIDVPVPPLILGLVLGKMLEISFRQAMTISGGSLEIFWGSNIAMTLLTASALLIAVPFLLKLRRGRPAAANAPLGRA